MFVFQQMWKTSLFNLNGLNKSNVAAGIKLRVKLLTRSFLSCLIEWPKTDFSSRSIALQTEQTVAVTFGKSNLPTLICWWNRNQTYLSSVNLILSCIVGLVFPLPHKLTDVTKCTPTPWLTHIYFIQISLTHFFKKFPYLI